VYLSVPVLQIQNQTSNKAKVGEHRSRRRYMANLYDGVVAMDYVNLRDPFQCPMGAGNAVLSVVPCLGDWQPRRDGEKPPCTIHYSATDDDFLPFIVYVSKTKRFAVYKLLYS
jgi:hypothetical protein